MALGAGVGGGIAINQVAGNFNQLWLIECKVIESLSSSEAKDSDRFAAELKDF